MKTKDLIIKETALTNHCPECFSNNHLHLSFLQKQKENPFYRKSGKDVEEVLQCKQCNTRIYPVRWTEDIERVVDFYRKTVSVRSRLHMKPLFWIAILLIISAVAAVIYITLQPLEVS